VCSGFATAWPLHAQAETAAPSLSSNLTLEPGATCLERDRLVQRVERWRERATIDPRIRVQVRGDAHEPTRVFFSVMRDGTQPTERVLANAPSDCDQLHSAVALSIALAIDAILSGDHSALPPVVLPKPSPPPIAAAGSASRHGSSGRLFEVDLLGGASVGVVTNTAPAGLPRLQVAPLPWLSIAAAGIVTRDREATISGLDGRFSVLLLAAGADACVGGETVEKLSFFMCAGGRGGWFTTEAAGFQRNFHATRPWWAVAASGQARVFIVPAIGIGISVEALFALAARDLTVSGESSALPVERRSVPRVGLSVAAGPIFRLF
jgi:hypothetical protein